MLPLTNTNLPALSRRLSVPSYDRRLLSPSIVHIGVGGFHRAHQGTYLDDLAALGCTGWGEVGVGIHSPQIGDALRSQDYLFTVLEQTTDVERARVIGVMSDYHFAPRDPRAVLDQLASPQTRIVSLTVTGDGYHLDLGGEFRVDDPSVRHDLKHPETPITWIGLLVAGLALRRSSGLPGLTVLSCDNLHESGTAARRAVLAFAELRDETLAAWIKRNVSFPNSMVDRITPHSERQLQDLMAREFGVLDRAPVATEPFAQWVLEDQFCQGRPPLQDVGVQLVSDVAPYKLIKTRLLNGTHTAMAYIGFLAGFRTTADTVANPVMRAFLETMMRDEVAPILPSVPGMDVNVYIDTVLSRLANPHISDPLSRLCQRGSTKVPSYLLPSLIESRKQGRPAPLLTVALAAWFRYLRGTDLEGRPITIEDRRLDEIQALARKGANDPVPLLSNRSLVGPLADDLLVRREVSSAMRDIQVGLMGALERRLHPSSAHLPTVLTGQVEESLLGTDLVP